MPVQLHKVYSAKSDLYPICIKSTTLKHGLSWYLLLTTLLFFRDKPEPELMPWQKSKILKSRRQTDQSETSEDTEVTESEVVERKKSVPEPHESKVHGKEVYVQKQKQTQKEVIIFFFFFWLA